jgi:RNA polymerase sigma-70 factor (ECF subfamily)
MIAASNVAASWPPTSPSNSLLDTLFAPKDAHTDDGPSKLREATRGQAIGELDNIDELVRKYRPRLLRFVTFSLGDPDLAESITQDTLLKAYNARGSFRGDSSVNTFLVSIAMNLVRDQQRTQKFRFWKQVRATALDITDVASFVTSRETSPEAQLLAREKVERLYTIIQTLSFTQRTVFLMRFSDEMDIQEISKAMAMPVNTVKTHLHRSLKAVRRQLGASQ